MSAKTLVVNKKLKAKINEIFFIYFFGLGPNLFFPFVPSPASIIKTMKVPIKGTKAHNTVHPDLFIS